MNQTELSWKDFKNFPVSANTLGWTDLINSCHHAGVELPEKMRTIQVLRRHPNQHPNIVANVYLADKKGNQWGFQAWKLSEGGSFDTPYCWLEDWNTMGISVSQMKESWLQDNHLQVMKNKRRLFAYRIAIAQFINILHQNNIPFQSRGVQKGYDGQSIVSNMVNIIYTYYDVILKGDHNPKSETVEWIKGSIIPENPKKTLGKLKNLWITGISTPNQNKENLTDALSTLRNEGVIKELYCDQSVAGNITAEWGKNYFPTRTKHYEDSNFIKFADIIVVVGLNNELRDLLDTVEDKLRIVIIQGQNYLLEPGTPLQF